MTNQELFDPVTWSLVIGVFAFGLVWILKRYIEFQIDKTSYTLDELLRIAEQQYWTTSREFTHFVMGIQDCVQKRQRVIYTQKHPYRKFYEKGYDIGLSFTQMTKKELMDLFYSI